MRIDLSRIRDINRTIVLMVVAVAAAIAISVWLIRDVGAREKEVDQLQAEVSQNESQAASLPQQSSTPLTPEQLAEKIQGLVIPRGAEQALQQELATIAETHHIEVRKITGEPTPVNPADTQGGNALLLAMGIASYIDITIEFDAEYEDAARFVEALENRPQRLLIQSLEMRRNPPRISGRLALRAYQKGS
jgi:Tfp pilus assembly protein PilO